MSDLDFQLAILQEFQKMGLRARLGLVQFFLNIINSNLINPSKDPKQEIQGLNGNHKQAILQLGLIAQFMAISEDIGLLCQSFLNDELNYYKYLDKKGDKDLGRIIGSFFSNTGNLKPNEIRKILSYGTSDDWEFLTSDEKISVSTAITNGVFWMKYFLDKVAVFYESHIQIYRRIKHATLPIRFGYDIPTDDSWSKKFEFWSMALTSRESITKEVTVLPFSKKVVESYENLFQDINQIFNNIINSRLFIIERNITGMIPYSDDYFSEKLDEGTKSMLSKSLKKLEVRYPPRVQEVIVELNVQAMYPAWYSYLDDVYSKSLFKMVEDNTRSNPMQ